MPSIVHAVVLKLLFGSDSFYMKHCAGWRMRHFEISVLRRIARTQNVPDFCSMPPMSNVFEGVAHVWGEGPALRQPFLILGDVPPNARPHLQREGASTCQHEVPEVTHFRDDDLFGF